MRGSRHMGMKRKGKNRPRLRKGIPYHPMNPNNIQIGMACSGAPVDNCYDHGLYALVTLFMNDSQTFNG
jgi:hypothetical protein